MNLSIEIELEKSVLQETKNIFEKLKVQENRLPIAEQKLMIIIDIEASGLHKGSYPIEIAWCDSDNQSCFDSFLIAPPDDWDHWGWDPDAERKIHHISRKKLQAEGISVIEAVARLNQRLAAKEVFSDAFEYDYAWLYMLFDKANVNMRFKVLCLYQAIGSQKRQAYLESFRELPTFHRALADVRKIISCLNLVLPEKQVKK